MSEIAAGVGSRAWLGRRLSDNRDLVIAAWNERMRSVLADEHPDDDLAQALVALVDELIAFLGTTDHIDTWGWPTALRLGECRYRQRGSVHNLLREFEVLGDVIYEFIEQQAEAFDADTSCAAVVRLMRAVSQGIETAEQQAVRAFMTLYSAAIEEQNSELLDLSRLVGHDIRKPLSVLQVLPQVMPVQEGDVHGTRLVDVLGRNVVRLAVVTHRLEQLAQLVERVKGV